MVTRWRSDDGAWETARVVTVTTNEEDLDAKLRARFGLPAFRPWQRDAVQELLEGRGRVLVVAPTGGGKSLCYQFPATELGGTSIVVSPLIALMEDQVRALDARGIPATFLASTVDAATRRAREAAMREGRYRLVYIAPERLAQGGVVEMLARLQPPLLAIDEAHCISQWGHDFRPDYLRLGEVVRTLGAPRVIACTATATPVVRQEIVARLGMEEARVLLRGFARPNLHLEAAVIDSPRARRRAALDTVRKALGTPSAPEGAAIVYAGTRRGSERMAEEIAQAGWQTAVYHAGREAADRAETSRRFAERTVDVVVATNAFGMGIDRPDIRTVVHVQAPGSIEAYYQEVGRAGRDGAPALGLLLGSSADFGLRRRLIERDRSGDGADAEQVARKWHLFLDLMRYVEAGSCRHDFILRYFGDEQETLGGCGHCDVCERLDALGGEAGERRVGEQDALVVRKALSGVARTHGRVGLRAVVAMLRGQRSVKMERLGLDRMSTFGLLSTQSDAWLMALLRRLVAAGLVDVSGDEYPVCGLTASGVEVMKGATPVRVLPPEEDEIGWRRGERHSKEGAGRRKGPKAPPPAPAPKDATLFEALRAARLEAARQAGVPAYVVCHDRTLVEIAARRPESRDDLADIVGMGPARIESWGDALLEAVRVHGAA